MGDEIVDALAEQHRELRAILVGLAPEAWERPTPCDGWAVLDVVLHLAQSDEMALGSLEGRFADVVVGLSRGLPPAADVDEGAALMVARDRHASPAEIHARWEEAADGLRAALGDADPHRRVEWVAGELSVRTLATTRLAECWIHTGDVAAAVAAAVVPTDRLRHIARLAWRTLPYAFARAGRKLAGPVAFELQGPKGDSWNFVPDALPVTTIRGDAVDLCLVAARRARPEDKDLTGEGPDVGAVLELVRTYA